VFAIAAFFAVLVSSASAQSQWVEHRAPERGFAALFPQAPQVTSSRQESHDKTITYMQYQYMVDLRSRAFIITVFEYPTGILPRNPDEKFWNGRVKDFAAGSKSVVRRESPVILGGRSGMEAVTSNDKDNYHYLLDFTLVEDRLYAVISAGTIGHESTTDAVRFRDSFRFIDK
jgi:hypothetical protein